MHYAGSLIKHKASKLTDRSNEVQTKRKSHCFQTGLLINMEILTYSSRVLSIFRLVWVRARRNEVKRRSVHG